MKFKYKFSRSIYSIVLIALLAVVAVLCFSFNLVRLVKMINSTVVDVNGYDYAAVLLCLLLPIACGVFIVATLTKSYYTVEKSKLVVKLGFLKDEYPVKDVANIINNVKTNELTVVFKDQAPLRIVIDENSFSDFSRELMSKNKNILYGETDEDDKKSK